MPFSYLWALVQGTRHPHARVSHSSWYPSIVGKVCIQSIDKYDLHLLTNLHSRQQTLNASLVPHTPHFTKAGLMEYIIELIVSKDDVSFPPYITSPFNSQLYRPYNSLTRSLFISYFNICNQALLIGTSHIAQKLQRKSSITHSWLVPESRRNWLYVNSIFMHKCCTEVNVTVYELLKWIHTHWASLFHMLERILLLRKVSILLAREGHCWHMAITSPVYSILCIEDF
jgi:hypothetical protein